jgi:AraC-like DNA-binding protein
MRIRRAHVGVPTNNRPRAASLRRNLLSGLSLTQWTVEPQRLLIRVRTTLNGTGVRQRTTHMQPPSQQARAASFQRVGLLQARRVAHSAAADSGVTDITPCQSAPRCGAVRVLLHTRPCTRALLIPSLVRAAHVRVTSSVEALVTDVRRVDIDVLVLDPESDGALRVDPATVGTRCGQIPLLLYVEPTPQGMRAALPYIAACRGCSLLFRGLDDSPGPLQDALERAMSICIDARLCSALEPHLTQLPASAAEAVRTALRYPDGFATADSMAASAGVTRRTLDRWLRRAGLAPAGAILRVARVARGVKVLGIAGATVADAARAAGLNSTLAWRRHFSSVFGRLPGGRPPGRDDAQLISLLASAVRRQ